jgi:hypothetical protein
LGLLEHFRHNYFSWPAQTMRFQAVRELSILQMKMLSTHFRVVCYIPGGFGDQDAAIARRR